MLNGSLFAIRQLDFDFLGALVGIWIGDIFFARIVDSSFLSNSPRLNRLRGLGLTVPFFIVEVFVGFNEVVDGEVVFAVEEAGAPTDDLFEFDHGVDRAHQDDVADVAGIDASGEFLGGGEDGGDGFLVVLENLQVLLA